MLSSGRGQLVASDDDAADPVAISGLLRLRVNVIYFVWRYNAAPTDYRDCIACAEGLCLETVWADPETGELFEYDDGTGWCGPCESDGAAKLGAAAAAGLAAAFALL